jgi:hypothetical protein
MIIHEITITTTHLVPKVYEAKCACGWHGFCKYTEKEAIAEGDIHCDNTRRKRN